MTLICPLPAASLMPKASAPLVVPGYVAAAGAIAIATADAATSSDTATARALGVSVFPGTDRREPNESGRIACTPRDGSSHLVCLDVAAASRGAVDARTTSRLMPVTLAL